jgi:YYY domain-containing protein
MQTEVGLFRLYEHAQGIGVNSIIAFVSWYFLITILGWLTFPLACRIFPALADRGYGLARVAGLLIWGYIFWLFTSLGLTQNTIGGILFALVILIGLSLSSFFFPQSEIENRRSEIAAWLRKNSRYILSVEILFLVAFAFLAFLRAGNPELNGTERPMELMFINSILRSPTFPPHDSWLSGYAISYYYFGYVLTAMLARLTFQPASLAHNLMTSLIFALAAVGAYGIVFNLLSLFSKPQSSEENSSYSLHRLSFLGPLFLLLISNLEGFLDVLHQRGIFWPSNPQAFNFWTWLGIKDLTDAPLPPLGWVPDRYLWWWRASRVISDFSLPGNFIEIIDEFPFFSFLLGDLHPHVLAIPFNLLAVSVALNLFLGGWRGEINLFGFRLHVNPTGFLFAALTVGGLAFLNTWDILAALALIVLAYFFLRAREDGWSWARLEDAFILALPLLAAAILLFLPFYFGFSSQAGGILPNLINPTRGAQLWVMFGSLFIPIFIYLAYLIFAKKQTGHWKLAFWSVLGLALFLWAFSWLAGLFANFADPVFAQQYLQSQGAASLAEFFRAASLRRLSYIGGLLTILILLIPTLAFLIGGKKQNAEEEQLSDNSPSPPSFVFLLILLASLLILAPEFVYLRDQFGSRMNTIFKFYYQAWILFSIAAAIAVAFLLQNLRGASEWIFKVGVVVLLLAGLTYPILAIPNKTNALMLDSALQESWAVKNPSAFESAFVQWLSAHTLDDFERIRNENPAEAAGIEFLKSAPDGIVVEAVGGSYTGFARISTYTGMSTIIGWPGHESQWGRGADIQGAREDDVRALYTTSNWQTALDILKKYNVRYVYIGSLERSTYHVQEDKFKQHLKQVFQMGDVTIYEAP